MPSRPRQLAPENPYVAARVAALRGADRPYTRDCVAPDAFTGVPGSKLPHYDTVTQWTPGTVFHSPSIFASR